MNSIPKIDMNLDFYGVYNKELDLWDAGGFSSSYSSANEDKLKEICKIFFPQDYEELKSYDIPKKEVNWRKRPKVYKKLAHLKSHLAQFILRVYIFEKETLILLIPDVFDNCVIYNFKEQRESDIDIYDLLKEHIKNNYSKERSCKVYNLLENKAENF